MMEKQSLATETITEQQAESPACIARLGNIVALNEPADGVRIEFEGNPLKQPLAAKLGRSFRRNELQMAIDNQLKCRVEFINGDLSLPVVTDIFFSILDDSDEFILRAKKMVIETEQELIVRSGETETRYSGRDGRISSKAKYMTSQAEKSQKIQGGIISIN